jgi:hypothetical protein
VEIPRIPLASANRVVHVTYPDLATHLNGRVVEVCPSGAVERPGDLVDGTPDGRADGAPPNPQPPFLSGAEWAWGDATLLQPADPAPDDAVPASYSYTPEAGGAPVPLALRNTLNSIVMESATRFGWTSSAGWWQASRGHGYCAPTAENYFFRAIFHPNDAGYMVKAAVLVAEAERLGIVPAAR